MITLKIEFDLRYLDRRSECFQEHGIPHFYINNFPGVPHEGNLISLQDFITPELEKNLLKKWPTILDDLYNLSYSIDYLVWEYNTIYGVYLKVFCTGE
jgi:hypothetical protein